MTTPPPDPPDRGGRPTKLTPKTAERIITVVRAGNYLNVAAQFAGVGISTLQGWLQRGRRAAAALERGEEVGEEETPYLEFLGAITEAEVNAEVFAATAWRSKVGEDWRAARDLLRYRWPDRWRAVTTVNIRPEEAEARIEHAVNEALTALGVPTEARALDPGEPDDGTAGTAALLAEFTDPEEEP